MMSLPRELLVLGRSLNRLVQGRRHFGMGEGVGRGRAVLG